MKQSIFYAALCFVLLVACRAWADDYLANTADSALMQSKKVLVYDQCVKEGYIQDQGPSAESKLRAAFNRAKTEPDPSQPFDITGDQMLSVKMQALDLLKEKMAQKPWLVDKDECDSLYEGWPSFAKQYGLK